MKTIIEEGSGDAPFVSELSLKDFFDIFHHTLTLVLHSFILLILSYSLMRRSLHTTRARWSRMDPNLIALVIVASRFSLQLDRDRLLRDGMKVRR